MTPFVAESLQLLHDQRGEVPPDHPKVGDGQGIVVYDGGCWVCRRVTADPPPLPEQEAAS